MNYCIYCGEKLTTDVKFCPACGKRLDKVKMIVPGEQKAVKSASSEVLNKTTSSEQATLTEAATTETPQSPKNNSQSQDSEPQVTALEEQIAQLNEQIAKLQAQPQIVEKTPEVKQQPQKTEKPEVTEETKVIQSAQAKPEKVAKPKPKLEPIQPKQPTVKPKVEKVEVKVKSALRKETIKARQSFKETVSPGVPASARVYLGHKLTFAGTNEKRIYWEFGNPQLANRHMLVTGKSGQGKTYFLQTLLYELSKQKISSLVVDYTDSYLPKELDTSFSAKMGDRVKQIIVYNEKLPLNPFKMRSREVGGISLQEKVEDMADRVVEVLDNIFNLGVQQRATVRALIMKGYTQYGEEYTFTKLKEQLFAEEKEAIYGRLSTLLDRDPFTYTNDFDWSQYFNYEGKVTIIQMVNFQKAVQRVMIEFLLWDLFYYSRSSSENLVYPVFLDEVQNLNFKADSPTVKILREGRKFGWAGIFATQALSSIKGEIDSIYNCAEQIHFLPTDDQLEAIGKLISKNPRKDGTNADLRVLKKGECIVKGPMLRDYRLVNNAEKVSIDSLDHR